MQSFHTPPKVLIRTPVTLVIVVSRGPLPHSLAAHFIIGSEAHNEWTVCDACLIFPLDFT